MEWLQGDTELYQVVTMPTIVLHMVYTWVNMPCCLHLSECCLSGQRVNPPPPPNGMRFLDCPFQTHLHTCRPPNISNKKILKRLRLCEGAKRPSPRERSDRAGGGCGRGVFQFWPPNGSIWCILLHTKIWYSTLPIPRTFPAAPAGIVARYTRPQSWQWMLQSAHCHWRCRCMRVIPVKFH